MRPFISPPSCGRTADGRLGNGSGKTPYLRAVEVKVRAERAWARRKYDGFESYIKREDVIAYDTSYPMFRWQTDLPADVASAQISGRARYRI